MDRPVVGYAGEDLFPVSEDVDAALASADMTSFLLPGTVSGDSGSVRSLSLDEQQVVLY